MGQWMMIVPWVPRTFVAAVLQPVVAEFAVVVQTPPPPRPPPPRSRPAHCLPLARFLKVRTEDFNVGLLVDKQSKLLEHARGCCHPILPNEDVGVVVVVCDKEVEEGTELLWASNVVAREVCLLQGCSRTNNDDAEGQSHGGLVSRQYLLGHQGHARCEANCVSFEYLGPNAVHGYQLRPVVNLRTEEHFNGAQVLQARGQGRDCKAVCDRVLGEVSLAQGVVTRAADDVGQDLGGGRR